MAEREADLARVEAQVKSLRQVEAEQQNIIDKLAVGEAYGRVPVEGTEDGFCAVCSLIWRVGGAGWGLRAGWSSRLTDPGSSAAPPANSQIRLD